MCVCVCVCVDQLANMRENKNVYRVMRGKPEGKEPLGRRKRRGEDSVTIDLK